MDDRQISSSTQHSADNTLVHDDESDDAASHRSDAWKDGGRIWMPSSHPKRTLILCFDGTGDEFDSDNSNVVQLVSMLKKDDTTQQLVYYQTGIGTSVDTTILSYISSLLDDMFAFNLPTHIKEGYAFLMQNYTVGDKICIFGFSRGAYTARGLAGMLQKIGLLPLHNFQQIPYAYDMFRREDHDSIELSELFKRTFCRQVHVDFLGVWDTVASVGAVPEYLPFINENNGVRHLRHALALDERRIKFLPSYCVESRIRQQQQQAESEAESSTYGTFSRQRLLGKSHDKPSEQKLYEDAINSTERATDVQEVWFAGVHCDVGGGSVKNDTPNALARIPLRWMIRECFRCKTGIMFDAVMLQQIGLNVRPDTLGVPVLYEPPSRIKVAATKGVDPPTGIGAFLNAVVRLTWAAASLPFRRAWAVLQSPFTSRPTGIRRRVIPYTAQLRKDLPEDWEAQEEMKDALSDMYDQLNASLWWVIMEYMPMRVKKQKAIVEEIQSADGFKWTINRGRGRKIYKAEIDEGLRVHRSVKTRLEAGKYFHNELYVPQVRPHLPALVRGHGWLGHKGKEPVRLEHHQWNVDKPTHWEWVG